MTSSRQGSPVAVIQPALEAEAEHADRDLSAEAGRRRANTRRRGRLPDAAAKTAAFLEHLSRCLRLETAGA